VEEQGSNRLLGVLDNKAWHGTIKSKKLRIFVAPARGGRLKIRVEDLSTPELTARNQVEVRIFRRSRVLERAGLSDAWGSLEPVTSGNTGQGGWVTLPPGGSCLSEPDEGDAYMAIARYKGEYKEAQIEQGAPGWQPECGGLLERYILFGEPPHQFSVFGLNSVWIRNKARVESGDIGAQEASEGPWLVSGFEISLGENAWVADGSVIQGDTVEVRSTASVWEVFCNEAGTAISGEVRQEEGIHYGLETPLWDGVEDIFPGDQQFLAKKKDPAVTVDSSQELTLPLPGGDGNPNYVYSDVTLSSNATLRLQAGVYDFMNLGMGSDARLVCEGPATIRIQERLYPGTKAYVGPTKESGLGSGEIKVFVKGTNGKKGGLTDKPLAAQIGEGNTVNAILYAKNGTLQIGEGCVLEGIFIALDVSVGMKTVVNFPPGASFD
jgi:hypothetical protein